MSEKINFPTDVQIHYDDDGEWSALYVDGKLVCFGDDYHQTEKIFELFGVKVVNDSPWLLGGNGHDKPPAQTLEEINAYELERDQRLNQAMLLRNQAAELRRQADDLDAGNV